MRGVEHKNSIKMGHLWKWMLVPFVVMQAGIFVDYWGDFSANRWAVHVHYWTVTAWYILLITQPWLIKSANRDLHRTWGMIGFFIAGAVAFLSISQLYRDLVYADFVKANPGQIGPLEPWFFIGIAICEIILITAFISAVVMAILRRGSTVDHAWWLVMSLFILLMPAVGRGLQAIWIAIYGFAPDTQEPVLTPLYVSQVIIILMIVIGAMKIKLLRHPATFVAVGANAAVFFIEFLGKSLWIETALRAIIRG